MRTILILALVGCASPQAKQPPPPAQHEPGGEDAVQNAPKQAPERLTITGISPDKGEANGVNFVRIKGTRFTADGARNVKVYFGAQQATVIRFASDTELIVEAPEGAPNQTVDLTCIFEPGGEFHVTNAFTYVTRQP